MGIMKEGTLVFGELGVKEIEFKISFLALLDELGSKIQINIAANMAGNINNRKLLRHPLSA